MKSGRTFLTIVSDASLCHEHRIAGLAAHLTYDGLNGVNRRLVSGVERSVNDITVAELLALKIGLDAAAALKLPKWNWFVWNTDSQAALDVLTKPNTSRFGTLGREIRKQIEAISLSSKLKKVKAHSSISDSRHRANRVVDEHARNIMRKARNAQ